MNKAFISDFLNVLFSTTARSLCNKTMLNLKAEISGGWLTVCLSGTYPIKVVGIRAAGIRAAGIRAAGIRAVGIRAAGIWSAAFMHRAFGQRGSTQRAFWQLAFMQRASVQRAFGQRRACIGSCLLPSSLASNRIACPISQPVEGAGRRTSVRIVNIHWLF